MIIKTVTFEIKATVKDKFEQNILRLVVRKSPTGESTPTFLLC
ncbi:hypothetical protein [Streptococcus pasteurianus]|nr:hypothetical protein [Streptococcus pasteurianus]